MQVGLGLPQFGADSDLTRLADYARAAEKMGYDSLWVGDRLLTPVDPSDEYPGDPKPYPPKVTYSADPLVLWAAAAAATTSIRLGSSAITATWHNPVILARALTTIDALSGGRLDVGFGTSWMRDEYTAAGVDWHSRGRRLEETLDVLHAWWTRNPVEYHGEFVELKRSVVDLRPVQNGGPSIFLGGWSEPQMERVGRRADGYLALAGLPDELQRHLWDIARRAAESAKRDPDALKRILRLNVTDPDTDALERSVEEARAFGADVAIVDFNSCIDGIDQRLDAAAALMRRVRD
jgi:probable F420-dependent oxidoreductase